MCVCVVVEGLGGGGGGGSTFETPGSLARRGIEGANYVAGEDVRRDQRAFLEFVERNLTNVADLYFFFFFKGPNCGRAPSMHDVCIFYDLIGLLFVCVCV